MFVYGVVERALLPFGLHHIWNVPFFFEVGSYADPATGKVIHGEIYRFVAGDKYEMTLLGGHLSAWRGLSPWKTIVEWKANRKTAAVKRQLGL